MSCPAARYVEGIWETEYGTIMRRPEDSPSATLILGHGESDSWDDDGEHGDKFRRECRRNMREQCRKHGVRILTIEHQKYTADQMQIEALGDE